MEEVNLFNTIQQSFLIGLGEKIYSNDLRNKNIKEKKFYIYI